MTERTTLVEVRDLDGPNLFLLEPAIKVEIAVGSGDDPGDALARATTALDGIGAPLPADGTGPDAGTLPGALAALAGRIHAAAGLPVPVATARAMETPGRWAVAFGWERRAVGEAVGALLADLLVADDAGSGVRDGGTLRARIAGIAALARSPAAPDDAPALYRGRPDGPKIVAVTGTNGKTTTTRLISFLLRRGDARVGWTSTAGIYVNGDEIETGDWSGPGGAWLLLERDDLDWVVLESARGGILRRGLAFARADAGVLTNVSDDHLGEQGVLTVEGLAEVKGVVVRAVRPGGTVVLNADDPLVAAFAGRVDGMVTLVSRDPRSAIVAAHVAAGGTAVVASAAEVSVWREGRRDTIVPLAEVPSTFGGRAEHMVENVLCAVAAAAGCGLGDGEIAAGLRAFGRSHEDNAGRLNVFDVGGVTVIADYAHNEAGLRQLLKLARSMGKGTGKVWSIIGTAGDRGDDVLRAMGRIAAAQSDAVAVKGTRNYLRGRQPGDMERILSEGVAEGRGDLAITAEDELSAIDQVLSRATAGDIVAVMSVDQPTEVREVLARRGTPTTKD